MLIITISPCSIMFWVEFPHIQVAARSQLVPCRTPENGHWRENAEVLPYPEAWNTRGWYAFFPSCWEQAILTKNSGRANCGGPRTTGQGSAVGIEKWRTLH